MPDAAALAMKRGFYRAQPAAGAGVARRPAPAGLLRGLAVLLVAAAAQPAFAELPPAVAAALDTARIPAEAVSAWVQPVDGSPPALAHNAARPMNPASTMKLVTAFAAFSQLGPAYTWHTRVARAGEVRNGRLEGELFLIGGADPMLDEDRVRRLLRKVRGLGVQHIAGGIVLDASALALPPHDPALFDGRPLRPYNSGPYGLLMHYNTLQLALFPAETGGPVTVVAEPPLAGLALENRLVGGSGACEPWQRGLEAVLSPAGGLVLSGSLPVACGVRNWSAAPLAPPAYAAALVGAVWGELGGTAGNAVREAVTPGSATILLDEESRPLADVIRDMNKWSSNVIARQLLATLGMNQPGDAVQAGAAAAQRALAEAGIDTSGLVIENGAGLSRLERVRADTLAATLLAAWQRPWMPEYIAALPVAGVDGTARRRLNGSPANGYAHLKTGTLEGVRAMAGYVTDARGQHHIVVMMVNHPQAAASAAAQDALVEWVWAGR